MSFRIPPLPFKINPESGYAHRTLRDKESRIHEEQPGMPSRLSPVLIISVFPTVSLLPPLLDARRPIVR